MKLLRNPDETIVESAIMQDGVMYTGRRHHNVIAKIWPIINPGIENPGDPGSRVVDGEQGFVTSTGRFVNRKQGAAIAIASGQIEKLKWPPDLYSEDLY